MDETDETLMAQYQAGEVAAFERLLARHERPVWGYLRRSVGDPAQAEDLLQEVFLRVVHHAGQWKPEATFRTWLYTIARNLCVDQARRATHRQARSLDAPATGEDGAPGASLVERLASGQVEPEAASMDQELGARIDRAVAGLPAEQREVFLMRETMDMTFSDIARATRSSEPTVKSRMRYALEKLRDALRDFTPEATGAEAR